MDTPTPLAAGQFLLRFSPAGDLHATLDAIRAELDRWDTRILPQPPAAQELAAPGQPSRDIPSSPLS